MKSIGVLMLCIPILFIAACASQPVQPPQWTYEKDAVKLHFDADARLNYDDGMAHTLVVCIYQLRDPNAFNQLSDDIEGIYKLLECDLFDASVATAKRYIIHPGQDMDVTLDRAEGARYVAAVAGYYTLQKERMIRLFEFPVAVEKKGFIKKTKTAKPMPLDIKLMLGASQIAQ